MTRSYIPDSEEGAANWMRCFRDHLNSDPLRYRLTQSDADEIAAAVDDFEAKRGPALDEWTRTKQTIAAKNDARAAAERVCRQYAFQIRNDFEVADGDKLAAGVRPINNKRKPIRPPATFPLLNFLATTPGCQRMRYFDSARPDSSAKPFGAAGLQVFIALGDEARAPLSEARYHGVYTRNPVAIEFDEPDDGKIATYYARWVNAKGEHGPWSLPVSMRIAA